MQINAILFLLLIASLESEAKAVANVAKPVDNTKKLRFDSSRVHDQRFQNAYLDLKNVELVDFDKRVAFVLQVDSFLLWQSGLLLYALIIQGIEPFVPDHLRYPLRKLGICLGFLKNIIDAGLRFHVPDEVFDVTGIFADNDVFMAAQNDMKKIARSKEGQQIAYAAICWFFAAPAGCTLPLIVRSVPFIAKSLALFMVAYAPSLASPPVSEDAEQNKIDEGHIASIINKMLITKKETVSNEHIGLSSQRKKEINHPSENGSKSDDVTATNDGSIIATNSSPSRESVQILLDFVCETSSLVLEFIIFTHMLLSRLMDFRNVKSGLAFPFILLSRLLVASMVVQYSIVRVEEAMKLAQEAAATVPLLKSAGAAPYVQGTLEAGRHLLGLWKTSLTRILAIAKDLASDGENSKKKSKKSPKRTQSEMSISASEAVNEREEGSIGAAPGDLDINAAGVTTSSDEVAQTRGKKPSSSVTPSASVRTESTEAAHATAGALNAQRKPKDKKTRSVTQERRQRQKLERNDDSSEDISSNPSHSKRGKKALKKDKL